MRKHERKNVVYVGFIDLEKAYDRGKLLDGIKNMYIYSLACVRIKGGVNEWFRKDKT